eukprot:11614262-Karenia_brevis.AAC.1
MERFQAADSQSLFRVNTDNCRSCLATVPCSLLSRLDSRGWVLIVFTVGCVLQISRDPDGHSVLTASIVRHWLPSASNHIVGPNAW